VVTAALLMAKGLLFGRLIAKKTDLFRFAQILSMELKDVISSVPIMMS
jgi:hypothetical protein